MALAFQTPDTVDQTPPVQPLTAHGAYSKKELKKISRAMRTSGLGPTSVYYAGVTAPAIAAGMATVVSAAFERAGWDPYWVFLISSIIASMSGISWYLIFMRLSYRHGYGRSTESKQETQVEIGLDVIFWTRGAVRTQVLWSGISSIECRKTFIHIAVADGEDVVLPKGWFGGKSEMRVFFEKLQAVRNAALGETGSEKSV